MTDQTVGNVPRIRFKGFNAAWERKALGTLYIERNERGNDSLPILSVSIHSGISTGELGGEALGKTVRRSEDKSLYKHVQAGDLVINMMRAWQGSLGVTKIEGMVSPAYITATPDEAVVPLFMDCGLRRPQVVNHMNRLSYGVTDFRKRLYWGSFARIEFNTPTASEQKNISTYFRDLESTISLHQRKYEKLVALKKATIHRMFPKQGASSPEIRFKGFFGDWVEKRLADVARITTGFPFASSDFSDLGKYLVITNGNIQNEQPFVDSSIGNRISISDSAKLNQFLLNVGDILVTMDGLVGRAAKVCATDQILAQRVARLVGNIDPEFLYQALNTGIFLKKMSTIANGGTIKHISLDDVGNHLLLVPSDSKEQRKIGAYFQALDTLITLNKTQIQKLLQIKSACLEAMFV